jgi:hypothetical protein
MSEKKERRPVTMKVELSGGEGCCTEATATVDGEGRLVLPEEFRRKAGIKAGVELRLFGVTRDGAACCVAVAGPGDKPARLNVTCCAADE